MKRSTILAGFGGILAIVLLAATPARALDDQVAAGFVDKLMKDAVGELAGKTLTRQERMQVFAGLLERYADTKATADELVGRYLTGMSTADQALFQQTFVDYILASWTDYLTDLSPKQTLVVTKVVPQGERLRVLSVIQVPGEDAVPVEWSVGSCADGRPYVAEVAMGGVGIVRMMRADFSSVLMANHGRVDGLIAALKKKIEFASTSRRADAGSASTAR